MGQRENERTAALEWLLEDPDHRCIISPTHVAALFLHYAANNQYPATHFVDEQFVAANRFGHDPLMRVTRLAPIPPGVVALE